VTDAGVGGHSVVTGRDRPEAVEFERQGVHPDAALVGDWPLLAWSIPVYLDAVTLRIREVQRLADEVVRRAG